MADEVCVIWGRMQKVEKLPCDLLPGIRLYHDKRRIYLRQGDKILLSLDKRRRRQVPGPVQCIAIEPLTNNSALTISSRCFALVFEQYVIVYKVSDQGEGRGYECHSRGAHWLK